MANDGVLDDFGMWRDGNDDTAITRTIGAPDPANDTDWLRRWIGATRPRAYGTLWREAAYGVAALKVKAVTVGEGHLISAVQFEKAAKRDNILDSDAANFESYLAYGRGDNALVSLDDSESYLGNRSLKVTVLDGMSDSAYVPLPEHGMVRATEGVDYSGYLRILSNNASAEFVAQIVFYDRDFEEQGNSGTSFDTITTAGEWDTFWTGVTTAPAGTAWVGIRVVTNGGTIGDGESYWVDTCGISADVNPEPRSFEDARTVYLNLRGDGINYVRNAIPDTGYMSGLKGYLGDLIGNAVTSAGSIGLYGGASIQCVNDDPASTFGFTTSRPGSVDAGAGLIHGLQPGIQYVASVWTAVDDFDDADLVLQVVHEDTYESLSRSQVLAQYPFDERFVQTDDTDRVWVRLWVPFLLPEDATGFGSTVDLVLQATSTSPDVAETFYGNAFMLHEGFVPLPFFDQSLWTPQEPDHLVEQAAEDVAPTAGWARSHWYKGRRNKAARVETLAQENLPAGTPFEIRYAQPPSRRRIVRDVYGRPLS